MTSDILLQFCVAGVTYGIIYGVVAIGFTIIYNTTGIINFAQGEFLMIGGMTAVTLHRLRAAAGRDPRRRGRSRCSPAPRSRCSSSAGSTAPPCCA